MDDAASPTERGQPVAARRQAWERVEPHASAVHSYSVLGFVLEGEAVVHQGQRFCLRPGDAYLIPAGSLHRMVSADSLEFWGVRFCPPCFAGTEVGSLYGPFDRVRAGASTVVPIPDARRDFLATLCAELDAETTARAPSPHGALAQRSLLSLILAEVSRAATAVHTSEVPGSLIGDALAFIERRCLEPITVGDVARAVHRSPAHVSTALRRATGKSVKAWIIEGRLAEACRRLKYTDEMVEIIAERVGYRDPTHFIRLFRRHYELTPAAWRSAARAPLA